MNNNNTKNEFKVGDKVKITRFPTDDELRNWDNCWVKEMDSAIGNEYNIVRINLNNIYIDDCDYSFPPCILELVKEEKIDINKKYKTRDGQEVVIYAIYPDNKNEQVHVGAKESSGEWVTFSCHIEGNYYEDMKESTHDLIEVIPFGEFKIDDKVIVWDNSGYTKNKRHFACVGEDGRPNTFGAGTTSFTSNYTTPWDNCIKYEEGMKI